MPPSVEQTPRLSRRQQGLISLRPYIALKTCTTQGSIRAQNDRDLYAQARYYRWQTNVSSTAHDVIAKIVK